MTSTKSKPPAWGGPCPELPSRAEGLTILDATQFGPNYRVMGVPVDKDTYLARALEVRASIKYGLFSPSPLGRNDRVMRTTSEATARSRYEFYEKWNSREPDQPWAIVGQGSTRENPSQGITTEPDKSIRPYPEAVDWEIALGFVRRLKRFKAGLPKYPVSFSVPREKGMGFPWLTREEVVRAVVLDDLEELTSPFVDALEIGTTAAWREAASERVFDIACPVNTSSVKGERVQPNKVAFLDGMFTATSIKQYWRWDRVGMVNVQRTTMSDLLRQVLARVRRVLGKNMPLNTLASLLRQTGTIALYLAIAALPSEASVANRLARSAIYGAGDQYDGDGTDTQGPPWLPAVYAYAALAEGEVELAATFLLVHLMNYGAAMQSSNVKGEAGISWAGDVRRRHNAVYMGVRSGIDPVALMALISAGHGEGTALQVPHNRALLAAVGAKDLPTGIEYWDWMAETCLRPEPLPGKPSRDWRGDGFLQHVYDKRESAAWDEVLCPEESKRDPIVHLKFQKDPTSSSDGLRYVDGDLRWDAPRRIAYFGNADPLRTDRTYLGIALVALTQALLSWKDHRVLDDFEEMMSVQSDGFFNKEKSFTEYASRMAATEVERVRAEGGELSIDNFQTALAVSSPDKLSYMPDAFLARVNRALVLKHRTFVSEERARQLYEYASRQAVRMVKHLPQIFAKAKEEADAA